MITTSPEITLNNGIRMPALGLGVYRSSPEETRSAVLTALQRGYRLIDTAAAYGNEKEVGEALRRSGLRREEVFVTTKLWVDDYGYRNALRAFEQSRRRLGVDYVDLYLLHWPVHSDLASTVASYRAAETLLAEGRVRAIGVSNHAPEQLAHLLARSRVVPSVNQVELHPFFVQRDVRAFDARHGIVTQSWSPIGGVDRYAAEGPAVRDLLAHPVIRDLARRYAKTPAQVVLRWHLDHGLAVIPKSVRAARIAENFDVFDFALTPQEVAEVDALDTGVRGGPNPYWL
ncbi:aldo/keto reductase [Streptomyces sp. enrichment culture]|uniref:aldo/keto reductase n=1 Tax=Streptomyces sp. enrichment culture TaxID=1795815 RepID=UPI003F54BA87